MKPISDKIYISAAIVAVAASIFYLGSTLVNPQSHVVTTTGEASAKVAPDQVTATFGVEADSASAVDAQNQEIQIANKIADAVAKFNIDQRSIQTTQISVEPINQYNPQTGETTNRGFRATNIITVTTGNIDIVGGMVDAVVAAGANRVDSVSFSLSDQSEKLLKTQLLGEAAADAKSKARSIAESVGTRVTGTRSVSESSFVIPLFASADSVKSGAPSTPVSPGEVEVTASVTASFDIA